jgi:hypothetical protein
MAPVANVANSTRPSAGAPKASGVGGDSGSEGGGGDGGGSDGGGSEDDVVNGASLRCAGGVVGREGGWPCTTERELRALGEGTEREYRLTTKPIDRPVTNRHSTSSGVSQPAVRRRDMPPRLSRSRTSRRAPLRRCWLIQLQHCVRVGPH